MSELVIEKPALWYKNYEARKKTKYVINQGGQASGKTWNIVDLLLYICATEKNKVITITGPNFPALNRGAVRDCMSVWAGSELYKKLISRPNQNGCKCETTNSVIEFAVFYNREVSKGAKRDILFINEATAMDYEIAFELMSRTKENVFIDFNPNARYWAHEKFEGDINATWIYSTHKANHFLPQSMHDEIEKMKDTDPERYRVYGLGECGQVEGCIFTNWAQVDDVPNEYSNRIIGLDFGFTNDPTAIVDIRYVDGQLWLKELCYKQGLTNFEIAEILKPIKDVKIVCDSAEKKSIEELRRLGIYNAIAVEKGPGSVMAGIELVKSFKINVEKNSNNIKSEFLNYKWQVDNLGHFCNKPQDKNNHACDAISYGVRTMFEKGFKNKLSLGKV